MFLLLLRIRPLNPSIHPSISMHSCKKHQLASQAVPSIHADHSFAPFLNTFSSSVGLLNRRIAQQYTCYRKPTQPRPITLLYIKKKQQVFPPVRPFIGLLTLSTSRQAMQKSKDAAGNSERRIEHRSWTLSIFDPSNPFLELAVFSSIQMKYHKSKCNRICIAFFVDECRKGSIMQTLPNLWRCTN